LDWTQTLDVHFIHDVNGNHSAREWKCFIGWIELTRPVAGHPTTFLCREWGRSLLAIEVKLSQTARYDDVRGLERFLASHPACRAGVLVYAGNETVRLGEKIVAVPWTAIAR
jgi:hypothetical protein